MRDRLPGLEVDSVQRPGVPVRTPAMRAAAERAHGRKDEPGIRVSDALPAEQKLRAPGLPRPPFSSTHARIPLRSSSPARATPEGPAPTMHTSVSISVPEGNVRASTITGAPPRRSAPLRAPASAAVPRAVVPVDPATPSTSAPRPATAATGTARAHADRRQIGSRRRRARRFRASSNHGCRC